MADIFDDFGVKPQTETDDGGPSTLGTLVKAPIKGAAKAVPQMARGALEVFNAPINALASILPGPVDVEGNRIAPPATPGTETLLGLEEKIDEALPTKEGALGQIGEGVGQVATMLATGGLAGLAARGASKGAALGAGRVAATRATTGAGVALSADEFAQDQLNSEGAVSGGGKALNVAIGALTGLTEALPLFKALERFRAPASRSRIGQTVQNTLAGTAEEGLQEAFQQTVQNMTASGIIRYDEDRGLFEGTGESAAIGGGVGGVVNFLATALGPGRSKSRLQESTDVAGDISQKEREQQALIAGEINPLTQKEFVSAKAGKEFQYLQNIQ